MIKNLTKFSCQSKIPKATILTPTKYDYVYKRFNNSLTSDIKNLKSKYDVVIVGAGHNGLVSANYLAKFSKKKLKICILENREVIGGAAVTQELIPGFKFSRASYLLSLFRPVILKDLDLMRHGKLKFYKRNPSSYTPLLESDPQYTKKRRSLTLSSDVNFNESQIEKFSKKDAKKFSLYEHWLAQICNILEKFIDMPPPSQKLLSEKNLFRKINYLWPYLSDLNSIKNYEDIYRLFTEPAAYLLDEWFESDVLKATLATDSVIGAMLSPRSDGSAYVLLHHIVGGVDGQKGVWAYVEGGMGSISECLAMNAKCFDDQIEIYTSQNVKEIIIENENSNAPKTKGVLLESGKFIESNIVMSNCTPHVTFNQLLGKYNFKKHSDDNIANFFKRIDNINYESGTMKINLAVSRIPNFLADPNSSENKLMPHHQTTIHFNCENMELIDTAFNDAKFHRRASSKPMIEMVIPSSLDPTLAPKGSHVVLLFCQYFPMPLNKQDNEPLKEKYANLVFDSIEQYCPGFKNSIIGKDILTPFDLEHEFGLTGGNIFHGAMPLSSLFINRPVSQWSNYNTPIKNLYLAGSGAHPGGGVMGSAGRLCALKVLEDCKSY